MQGTTGRPVTHSGVVAPTWWRRRPWRVLLPSTGRRLVAVAVLLALLLAGLSGTLAIRRYDGHRARTREQALTFTRAAAAEIDRFFADRVLLLETLALSPAAQQGEFATLHTYFGQVRDAGMGLTEVFFAVPDGRVVASSASDNSAAPVNLADRTYFRTVLATSKPAISDPVTGRVSGRRIVVVAVPVRDPAGGLVGVLALGVTAEHLRDLLRLPREGSVSYLIGPSGQVHAVAGGVLPEATETSGALLQHLQGGEQEAALTGMPGLNGASNRLAAFAPVSIAGWTLVTEQPEVAALGDARRELGITLTMLAVLLLAGMGGMVVAGRRLDRATAAQQAALRAAEEENAERHRAETALRLSEQRFRSLVQHATDVVAVLDTTGAATYLSPSAQPLLGHPAERFSGLAFVDLLHPDDRGRLRESFARALSQPGHHPPVEFRVRSARGTWRWLEARATNLLDNPAVGGIVQNVRDVTDRHLGEEVSRFFDDAWTALAGTLDYPTALDRLARLAVPFLGDWCAVDMLEDDGQIRRLVMAASHPEQQAAVQQLRSSYPHDPQAPGGVPHVLRTGEPELIADVTDEYLVASSNSPEHLDSLRALGMRSILRVPLIPGDRPIGVLSLVMAQSGRRYNAVSLRLARGLARRAALSLEHARLYHEAQEALAMRDEFFSSISHDLRTPLTAVKSNAQMLRRRLSRGGDMEANLAFAQETLAAIDDASVRMTGMISELLDLSRLQTGRPLELESGPVDLAALLRQEVAWLQATTSRHTITVTAEDRAVIEADGPRLERVIANLLSNAIKYSPAGGEVSASLHRVEDDGGSWLILQVADQGIGIPEPDLPHIFERFRRGSNATGIAGSGIGLAGARQIVEQHGGTITVESRLGEGATITVRLPASLSMAQE